MNDLDTRALRSGTICVIAGAIALCAACASRQQIPLDCVPEELTIYVDQQVLDERPEAIELSTDRPHKIYLKGPGYEPLLIVLEPTQDQDGNPTLSPDQVCVNLVAVGVERELTLEVERENASDSAESR